MSRQGFTGIMSILLIFVSTFSLYSAACVKEPCDLVCEYGFGSGDDGCEICSCLPPYAAKKDKGKKADVSEGENEAEQLQEDLNTVKEMLSMMDKTNEQKRVETDYQHGVTYIRWGRTECIDSASVVYSGYVGASHRGHAGGAANYLCLPDKPQFGNHIEGWQTEARIYGTEYEFNTVETLFSKVNNYERSLHNHGAPCTLCLATGRSVQVMIPARRTCPSGWRLEFRGYLVSAYYGHPRTEYICLDESPEAIYGSNVNRDEAQFYPVEATCGTLNCPPYVDGWELACVVCTK